MSGAERSTKGGVRRTDLDVLRVVICAAVILAHALLIFADEPRYHVKSGVAWPVATVLYEALRIGTLCTFFALAGWSAVASMRRRSVGRYLRDRAVRILVPLAAGIVLLGPVIKFIELGQGRDLRMAGFREVPPLELEFLAFVPRYFGRLNLVTWSHLWFLAYLFIISVALVPLVLHLARRVPAAAVPGRGMALVPGVVLAAVIVGAGAYWPFLPNLVQDGPNLLMFATCFAIGAVLAAWPGLEARLRAGAPWRLLLALGGLAGVRASGPSVPGRIAVGLCAWGCIGAGFGYAGRYQPRPSAALSWLGEATLPVYVLHHIPVLWLGVLVLPLAWGSAAKVAVIWLAATVVSLVLYVVVVVPWRVPRFLLGMDAPRG